VVRTGRPCAYCRSSTTSASAARRGFSGNSRRRVGERFALVAAHRVFAAFEGTDLARWIDSAVAKLAASLGPTSERKLAGIARRLAYVPDGGVKVAAGKDDVVDAFVSAILHSNGVRAAYTSRDGRKRSGNFEPYGFAIYRHGLYVVGRWKTASDVRVYAIERFSSATRLRAAIDVPGDFDVRRFFSGAFGVWVSEPATNVVLDFHPDVADVLAKRVYHESQIVEVLPSGVTRVTLAIGATPDLVSWVLSWGTCVYVRSPDELRTRVELEHELSMERPDWAVERNDAKSRAVETGQARGQTPTQSRGSSSVEMKGEGPRAPTGRRDRLADGSGHVEQLNLEAKPRVGFEHTQTEDQITRTGLPSPEVQEDVPASSHPLTHGRRPRVVWQLDELFAVVRDVRPHLFGGLVDLGQLEILRDLAVGDAERIDGNAGHRPLVELLKREAPAALARNRRDASRARERGLEL